MDQLCLVQLLTWLHASDYHNFWNNDSPSINTLVPNNYICHRNIFQYGVNTFSKKLTIFCQELENFAYFVPYNFVQISSARGSNTYQIYIIWYVLGPHVGQIWTEPNRMVRNVQNFDFFGQQTEFFKPFLTKRWRLFARRFYSWNNCLMVNCFQTTIFQCSKSYGSPTRVISLKVEPNMADPTSMKHTVSSLQLVLHLYFLQHKSWIALGQSFNKIRLIIFTETSIRGSFALCCVIINDILGLIPHSRGSETFWKVPLAW